METIIVDRADGVVTVTLNRPERLNALTTVMWAELEETFRDVAKRDDDRALVITGAGRAFCSGADLESIAASHERHALVTMRDVSDTILALHRLPKPTIAKVNGVAAGAGCNLALSCDLIVASDQARFAELFVRRGLSVDAGGTWLLPRLVGLHRAKELALLGDIISAGEASGMGLVNRVVAADELDGFVDDWAARLAAGPPLALSMTKLMLNASIAGPMDRALETEAYAQSVNLRSADVRESMAAYVDKRAPNYVGH